MAAADVDFSLPSKPAPAFAVTAEGSGEDDQDLGGSGGGVGLPQNLKQGLEQLSGFAMDDVKVHYNSSKPAAFQAEAFARGSHIFLGKGAENHLAHEAWHVVQQKQGRVQATGVVRGARVNQDGGLEKEADEMGGKAWTFQPGNSHEEGCTCEDCCGARMKSSTELKRVSLSESEPLQMKTKITIQDSLGNDAEGASGNASATESAFAEWPELKEKYESVVMAKDVPKRKNGAETGETYLRGVYNCAEPHALSLLLRRFSNATQNTVTGEWLKGLKFTGPARADEGHTVQTCVVCEDWVTKEDNPEVKDVFGLAGLLKNSRRIKKDAAEDAEKTAAEKRKAQEEFEEEEYKSKAGNMAEGAHELFDSSHDLRGKLEDVLVYFDSLLEHKGACRKLDDKGEIPDDHTHAWERMIHQNSAKGFYESGASTLEKLEGVMVLSNRSDHRKTDLEAKDGKAIEILNAYLVACKKVSKGSGQLVVEFIANYISSLPETDPEGDLDEDEWDEWKGDLVGELKSIPRRLALLPCDAEAEKLGKVENFMYDPAEEAVIFSNGVMEELFRVEEAEEA